MAARPGTASASPAIVGTPATGGPATSLGGHDFMVGGKDGALSATLQWSGATLGNWEVVGAEGGGDTTTGARARRRRRRRCRRTEPVRGSRNVGRLFSNLFFIFIELLN